jgi:hypothetical protein
VRTPQPLQKAAALLPTLTGSLLIVAAVAYTLFANCSFLDLGSEGFWSMLAGSLPIPGGGPIRTPELDPTSIASALALAVGGTLLIVDRCRHR